MSINRWKNSVVASLVASDIPDGSNVNLGIGRPEAVANAIPSGREIFLHSENGVLGMGPAPGEGEEDWELVNAGKKPVTLIPGGAFFHHADSFAMIRGGHIDICVMGAFQVGANGDLANWSTGAGDAIPAVGGAMDLAVGAKSVFVMMTHTAKDGTPKIVDKLTYPLTGSGCVRRIYTDCAVLEVEPDGLLVTKIVDGLWPEELQNITGATLSFAPQIAIGKSYGNAL